MKIDEEKINQVLTRGVEEVIDLEHLKKALFSGKKLRIKLGIDPTSPNLHIGRSIPLLKLKDFQDLGHKIVLIIGDFTGVIGDTSDKDSERPMLEQKMIKENMKTYVKQVSKILDIKKCEVRYNSEWLKKLDYHEIGKQANNFSLNEFISRENIRTRLDQGKRISLRELMYPLMQGYDSVAIKADVEIGGTDQRFNLLAGRELQRYYRQEPQDIITNPLIEGLDGRKMSSSWGNTINLFDSPSEMFGKVMSLKDEFIIKYFTLVTRINMAEILECEKSLKSGANPRDYKAKLAKEIVKLYHGENESKKSEDEFNKVFRDKDLPSDMPILKTDKKSLQILDLLCLPAGRQATALVSSKSEAKRLVEQGAVKINGIIEKDWRKEIALEDDMVIKVGNRRFVKVKIL